MPQADLAETLIAKSISEDDILRCHELSTEAGWNHTIKDWGFLATMVWSKGYRRRDRIVGTAVNVDLDHELSWIAMVLVDKAYRRQGIGIRMLSDSVDAIERSGKSAGLDASAHGLPLYQKLGFKEHYKLTRFRGSAPAPVQSKSFHILPLDKDQMPTVLARDHVVFGRARPRILRYLFSTAPHLAIQASDPSGHLLGFTLARFGRIETQIGPIIARRAEVAQALVASLSKRIGGFVILDVPQFQTEFIDWLRTNGFAEQRSFVRMIRGPSTVPGQHTEHFAAAGPEFS